MKYSKQVIRIRAVSVYLVEILHGNGATWRSLGRTSTFISHPFSCPPISWRPRHIASASLSPLLCFLALLSSYHHCHECAYLPRKDSEWSNAFEICKKGKSDGDVEMREAPPRATLTVFCGQLSLVSLADMSTWQTLYHRNNGRKQGTLFQRIVHLRITQKWFA